MPGSQRDQRALRAARRAARESARRESRALPKSFTRRSRELNEQYAKDVISGKIDRPPIGSLEGKSLARWGSLGRWGKADASYEAAFKDYWYHDRDNDEREEED